MKLITKYHKKSGAYDAFMADIETRATKCAVTISNDAINLLSDNASIRVSHNQMNDHTFDPKKIYIETISTAQQQLRTKLQKNAEIIDAFTKQVGECAKNLDTEARSKLNLNKYILDMDDIQNASTELEECVDSLDMPDIDVPDVVLFEE